MVVNAYGGSGETDSRDGACTPKWLAELIGEVALDPASNHRSHIQATIACDLASGDDGLWPDLDSWGQRLFVCEGGSRIRPVLPGYTVFCNPPYARGQVIRWVRHYKHTRFIFLLRWDPSTKWFDELIQACDWVWFPRLQRIEFEPPPGVTFSKNPFPHALYLRDPSPDLLRRLGGAGFLLDARFAREYLAIHGQRGPDHLDSGANQAAEGGAGGVGAGAGAGREGDWISEGIAAWIPPSCKKCGLFDAHCSCDAAGGEVPGSAPPGQRVRRRRAGRAAGDNGGGEVGAQRDAGEGDGDVPQR